MFKKLLSLGLAAAMTIALGCPVPAAAAGAPGTAAQMVAQSAATVAAAAQTVAQSAASEAATATAAADDAQLSAALVDIDLTSMSEEETEDYDFCEEISEADLMESIDWNVEAARTVNNNEYYESTLSETEAEIYAQLEDITAEKNSVAITFVPTEEMTSDEAYNYYEPYVERAMVAYMLDHPEKLYFNDQNGIRLPASGSASGDTCVKIVIYGTYEVSDFYTKDLETSAEAAVDAIVDEIVSQVPDGDECARLKAIHDYLVLNACYDKDALGCAETDERFYYAHGPLGILLNHTGVCESYAKTYKIICNRLNLPCVGVNSETHMWNYVRMEDGQWYMIDCTWDDPVDGESDYVSYDFFLVSNNPASDASHVEDDLAAYPQTSKCGYFTHTYGEYTVTKAATCTETGVETATCTVCGCEDTRTIPVDPANHVGETIVKNTKDATCEEAGYTGDTYCTACETVTEEGSATPALGHTLVTVEGYAATALKTGKTDGKKCSVCGKVVTAQKTIAKLTPTIKLSATSKKLKVKKTYTLTISKLAKGDSIKSVVSTRKAYATVKKVSTYKYKITAKNKGTAYIKVTLKSGKTARCKVVVK